MVLLAESPEARRKRERNAHKSELRRQRKAAAAQHRSKRLCALHTATALLSGRAHGPILPRGNCNVRDLMKRLLAEAGSRNATRARPARPAPSAGRAAPAHAARDDAVSCHGPAQSESVPPPSTAPAAERPSSPPPASNLFELLDLCSGLGGFVKGLRSIITNVLAYCELDNDAVAILKSLLHRCQIPQPVCTDKPIFPDVRTLLADPAFKALMKVDNRNDPLCRTLPLLLAAGWPCQVRLSAQQAGEQLLSTYHGGVTGQLLGQAQSPAGGGEGEERLAHQHPGHLRSAVPRHYCSRERASGLDRAG